MAGMRAGSGVPSASNKVHFACFACRKSFKQPGSSNWDSNVPDRPFPCPECKRPMARMGRHFKAPPRRSSKDWARVESEYLGGERFD